MQRLKLPVVIATIYRYAYNKFERFPAKLRTLTRLKVSPSMISANEARPHLWTDIIVWKGRKRHTYSRVIVNELRTAKHLTHREKAFSMHI